MTPFADWRCALRLLAGRRPVVDEADRGSNDAADAAGESLFVPVSRRDDGTLSDEEIATLPRDVSARYTKLRETSFVGKRMRLVRIDTDQLDRTLRGENDREVVVRVPLFADLVARARGARDRRGDRLRAWRGRALATDPPRGGRAAPVNAALTLTWIDRFVFGGLDQPGAVVRVTPLGAGFHAIYEVQARGLPPDHAGMRPLPFPRASRHRRREAVAGRAPAANAAGDAAAVAAAAPSPVVPSAPVAPYEPGHVDPQPQAADADGVFTLSVAFGFTKEAAAELDAFGSAIGDLLQELFAWWLVLSTNQHLEASGVAMRLALARAGRTDAVETILVPTPPVWDLVQVELASPRTIEAFELHRWWGESDASAMVLIGSFGGDPTGNTPDVGYCGTTRKPSGVYTEAGLAGIYDERAGGFPVGSVAYAVVKRTCAQNHYTVAHEIGHMLGADHDRGARGIPLQLLVPRAASSGGAAQGPAAPQGGGAQRPAPVGRDPTLVNVAYGHVIATEPARQVTLMVVGDDGADRENRVGLFSTTGSVPHPPVAIPPGSAGDAGEDNARMMNLLVPWLVRHRPPKCPP